MTGDDPLVIRGLNAWYGESHVLHGIDLSVRRGECICVLGRNGAGRTSILRAILGLQVRRAGSIRVHGRETVAWPTHAIGRLGVGYCPEERGIYSSLSCEENLLLPPAIGAGALSLHEIYALFPNLLERRHAPGTRLSGGEQQMLAIARILRMGAPLLMLDEISEGLAPAIVAKLGQVIGELKRRGYTLVMVEQNFRFAAPLAERFYVIEHGCVVDQVAQADLASRAPSLQARLGI